MNSSFFISGVPCTGKTWLGSWLSEKEGYIHIDAEKNGGSDLDSAGLHQEWDAAIGTGRADDLAKKIAALSKPVVLNWGFPMDRLYFIRALQVAGIRTWWIRADSAQARTAFNVRGGIDLHCFDRQITDINRNQLLLEYVFGCRIIDGLTSRGKQRHPSELWSEMNQREQAAVSDRVDVSN